MIEKSGYARTKTGIVYICGFDKGLYETVSVGEQRFRQSEHELTPWIPMAGERVTEKDDEKVTGDIVTAGPHVAREVG